MKVDETHEEQQDKQKHHLFENDQYEQVLINATWYNKIMPKKSYRARRGAYVAADTEREGYMINLESIKT